jgi:putative DNA primase/helicase
MISSALSLLQDEVFVPAGKFDSDPSVLPLYNGVLVIASRTLRSYRPEDYITTTLPYDYDPAAYSDILEKVLSGVDDECRSFLQEYLGLCLTPDTHHELALMLVGPPGGGKSTFIDAIQTMTGGKSGVLGLEEIARSAHATTQVVGKNVIICSEQQVRMVDHLATFIRLISGEPIPVNPKHLPAFEYRPHAKVISAMNELPEVGPGGTGLIRRLAIVNWPAVPETLRDPAIKEQICTQGPAILNYALAGLDRLRQRGRFELPTAVLEARAAFRETSYTNVQVFLDEQYLSNSEGRVQAEMLRADYEMWCALNDQEPLPPNKFSPLVDRQYRFVKPKNVKFWVGLTPKSQVLDSQQLTN